MDPGVKQISSQNLTELQNDAEKQKAGLNIKKFEEPSLNTAKIVNKLPFSTSTSRCNCNKHSLKDVPQLEV